MDNRCIALYDSGVGGLVLLKRLKDSFPSEDFLYFSDSKNFPYGDKRADELKLIAENKITKIVSFSPKFIVLACNTLSTAILNDYSNFCVKVFGVLPVVPPNKKTLLIATKATANSDYVKRIIKNKDADVISAEGLADEIERWVVGGKKPNIAERFKDTYKNYDVVSLGCTHYTLLKDEFSKVFPFSTICDGGDVTFEKIKGLLPTIQHAEQKGSVIFFNKKDEEWFYRLNREF